MVSKRPSRKPSKKAKRPSRKPSKPGKKAKRPSRKPSKKAKRPSRKPSKQSNCGCNYKPKSKKISKFLKEVSHNHPMHPNSPMPLKPLNSTCDMY